jgi:hypothetical protein
LVGIGLLQPVPRVIVFQYNPDTLTRSLQAREMGNKEGRRAETPRLMGAPIETIQLEVAIDATDQLESRDSTARQAGIYPQLAALELLLYPASATVTANAALALLGTLEIVPPAAPLTLFVWGHKRILPVRLTDFSITEEAHDQRLNPLRARVALGLRVLTYDDLPITHPGYHLFLGHQIGKEVLGAVGSVGSLGAVLGGPTRLL